MQRPFVFLATSDPDFERVAIDAILRTRHGVRRAHDLDESCFALLASAAGIALAIVDTTHRQFGPQLLEALNGTKADFPVLAITDADSASFDHLDGLDLATLDKSAPAPALQAEIRERCAEIALCDR